MRRQPFGLDSGRLAVHLDAVPVPAKAREHERVVVHGTPVNGRLESVGDMLHTVLRRR